MGKISKLMKSVLVAGGIAGVAAYLSRKKDTPETETPDSAESDTIQREYATLNQNVESSFGDSEDADHPTAEEAAKDISRHLSDELK